MSARPCRHNLFRISKIRAEEDVHRGSVQNLRCERG